MRRVVVAERVGGPEVLRVVDEPERAPGPGEILVDVRAAGVNPVDAKRYGGSYGPPPQFPMRLGAEAAGVVRDVGPDAVGPAGPVRPGDEVVLYRVLGSYADSLTVPAASAVPKPASLSWPAAAGLMLAGATGVHALAAVGASAGETLLVHAASGAVGLMTVQLARLRGIRVVGTASERHHDLLRGYGAEPVAYGPGLADRVRRVAPDGIAAAVDAVGTDEALDVSLDLVGDPARVAELVVTRRARDAGVLLLGGAVGADPGTQIRDAARPELARLAGAGELEVLVAATYPLTEVAQAHRAIAGRHPVGKIALVP
jgi:NADPH:quinone reductase-like Zn-dependent oxidoreductase